MGRSTRRFRPQRLIILILIGVAALCLWLLPHSGGAVPDAKPSAYYWRTTYRLSAAERGFITAHRIRKLYMRFFDVVMRGGDIEPNATIQFVERPDTALEVIPTVFIDEPCLHGDISRIAPLLVRRVLQICATNDVAPPREVQIDCDYTARTRQAYYSFLRTLRKSMAGTPLSRLSVTVRLHQLSMPVPPSVDYGVLMMYNTGDVSDYRCKNPILSLSAVKPYLRYLAGYRLPLCAAYPNFQWQLLFRRTQFQAILHSEDLSDSTVYRRVSRGKYLVVSSRDLPAFIGDAGDDCHIRVGDSVFIKSPTAAEIMSVKRALESRRRHIHDQVIIYDINSQNIQRYNFQEYEKIIHY